ncbi:MAG: S8 family serine peptidase [Bryobacteraceae bacterium]
MRQVRIWIIATFFSLGLAAGQVIPGRYIVELTGGPALEAETAAPKETRRAQLADRREAVRQEQSRVRAMMEALPELQILGSVDTVANALVVEATGTSPDELARMPGVKRVLPVRLYKLLLDRAEAIARVPDAWVRIGGAANAGAGIKIGIIDTGIDVSHPGFRDPSLPPVAGFPRVNRETDLQFTNNKVIVARSYDRRPAGSPAQDTEGHGTGVAMIAAGATNAGPLGTITGVAPKAYLGSYKVFPDGLDGAPTDLILKALDDAVADGMDVLNLSLGSFPAERPPEDILALAIERAAAAGVIVVAAAGNEGPGLNTISSPATAASAIAVGNSANDRIFVTQLTLSDGSAFRTVKGSGSNSDSVIRGPLADAAALDPSGLACGELPPGSFQGQVVLILRGMCTFEEKLNHAERAGAVAAIVYTNAESPEAITMSVGQARLPAAMVGHADGLEIKARMQAGVLEAALGFNLTPFFVDPRRLTEGSSRGPGADLAVKPDLVAVGTSIYTADLVVNGIPEYQVVSGTSLSTPMVAGAAAVLKAARPGLRSEQYRSLLVNSASVFSFDSLAPAAVQDAGAGGLNLDSAVASGMTVSPVSIGWGAGGGTADLTRTITLANTSSAADTFTVAAQAFGGGPAPAVTPESVSLKPGTSGAIAARFLFTGLAPGVYQGFLVVRSTATALESRIPYWYAVRSETAKEILVLEAPGSGLTSSTQEFLVRATEPSGVPLTADPTITQISGGGTVISVDSMGGRYPGFYEVTVQLGPVAGENVFEIEAGQLRRQVTIRGR